MEYASIYLPFPRSLFTFTFYLYTVTPPHLSSFSVSFQHTAPLVSRLLFPWLGVLGLLLVRANALALMLMRHLPT